MPNRCHSAVFTGPRNRTGETYKSLLNGGSKVKACVQLMCLHIEAAEVDIAGFLVCTVRKDGNPTKLDDRYLIGHN